MPPAMQPDGSVLVEKRTVRKEEEIEPVFYGDIFPKEFYAEVHRPAHFMNFATMEEVEQAAEADHEDYFD